VLLTKKKITLLWIKKRVMKEEKIKWKLNEKLLYFLDQNTKKKNHYCKQKIKPVYFFENQTCSSHSWKKKLYIGI
jgi:hypothetical protein